MFSAPRNYAQIANLIACLGKDTCLREDDQKVKFPHSNLESTGRRKNKWHDPVRVSVLESVIENFRVRFNVAMFDLNSNRIR